MKFYKKDGEIINAVSCVRPKMTNRSGRTWDSKRIAIDEVERDFHYDSTWGKFMYFMYGGTWYKTDVWDMESVRDLFTEKDMTVDKKKQKEEMLNLSLYKTIGKWNQLRYNEHTRNLSLDDMWNALKSEEESLFNTNTPLLDTFDEFVGYIKNPNTSHKKIIAVFNGIYREKDLMAK